MAPHEHEHDETDASPAGDQEAGRAGQPPSDGAGADAADPTAHLSTPATEEPGPDVSAPVEEAPPGDVGTAPDAVQPAAAGTNDAGPAEPVVGDPVAPEAAAPVEPEAAAPVEPEALDPGDDVVAAEDAVADPATNGGPVPATDEAGQPVAPAEPAPGAAGRREPGGARGTNNRATGGRRPPARGRDGAGRSGPPRNRQRRAGAGRAAPPPGPQPDADEPTARPSNRRGMVILLSALSVLAVVLTIVAINLSRSAERKAASPTTTTATTRPVATLPDAAFTTFRDDKTGFSIRYPTTWERRIAPHGEVRLYVSNRGAYSALIRVQEFEQPTTPENLGNLRAFTDGSVAGEGVQVLKVDPVTINGLIGYRYLYTFIDENSGIQGAHLHYFLFQGRKTNSIIFQALPVEEFAKAEGIFNQMLDSFRSDPDPTVAVPPPTSAAPPSPGG